MAGSHDLSGLLVVHRLIGSMRTDSLAVYNASGPSPTHALRPAYRTKLGATGI